MDNPLLRPDPGLFIWTIFTFLVLLAVLAKFAWGPLLKALESRQQSIRAALDDAQRAKQELERLEQESTQIMRKARSEAEAIITASRSDAERLREEIATGRPVEADNIEARVDSILTVAGRFSKQGVDFLPAVRDCRAALDAPRQMKVPASSLKKMDTWLSAKSK